MQTTRLVTQGFVIFAAVITLRYRCKPKRSLLHCTLVYHFISMMGLWSLLGMLKQLCFIKQSMVQHHTVCHIHISYEARQLRMMFPN